MIVSNIETLKACIPTIVGKDFTKYKPYLEDANDWLIKEITGKALYDIIEDPGNEKLLKLVENVVANKGYLEGIPFFDLIETDAGFAVMRTDSKAPASRERVNALVAGIKGWLSTSIESLLEYLENNIQYHTAWKGSPVFSLLYDTYIFTLRDFRNYGEFSGTRMEFIKLKPTMQNVIQLKISPVISEDLSDEIIEQLRDNDITPENKKILEKLRFAFANFVIGKDEIAQSYLMKVRKTIMRSPDSYPAFKNSELYAALQVTQASINDSESPMFFAGV